MKKTLLILAWIVVTGTSCSLIGNGHYADPKTGFTMSIPAGWQRGPDPKPGYAVWRKNSRHDRMILVNIAQLPEQGLDLNTFSKGLIRQYILSDPTTQFAVNPVVVNDLAAVKIYTETQQKNAQGNAFTLAADTYVFVKGDQGIRVMLIDSLDGMPDARAEVQSNIQSIKLG